MEQAVTTFVVTAFLLKFNYIYAKIVVGDIMKKLVSKLKYLLAWALCIIACFVIVFFSVFCGGWELFESGDPIKIEIGASVILGTIFFATIGIIYELEKQHEEKLEKLKKRIEELEKKCGE